MKKSIILALLILVSFNVYSASTDLCTDTDGSILMHMDGTDASTTFTDSTAKSTLTAVGNAQIDTAQSKFGGASGLFDGNDTVTAPDSSEWDLGTGNFTMETWIRFNTLPSVVGIIMGHNDSGEGQATGQWTFQWCASGTCGTNRLRLLVDIDVSTRNIVVADWSPSTSTWYHVVVIRTGSTVRFFVDGTQVGSDGTATETFTTSATPVFHVGSTNTQILGIDGWLDELRVVKGAAVWTSNFTSPSAAYADTCVSRRRILPVTVTV